MMSTAGNLPGGPSKRVCRGAKAQDFCLRDSQFRRNTALRQWLGEMALALHYGINL